MFSKSLFVLALAATGALAQSGTESSSAAEPTTSLPAGITPCVIGCIQPAAQSVGCDFTDPSCVCNSQEFITQATQCLTTTCSAEEVQAALALQQQQCGAIGPSSAASSAASSAPATSSSAATSNSAQTSTRASATSTTPSNSASTSRSATSSASSPAATTGNAAVGNKGSMGLVGLVLAGVFGLVL